MSEAPLANDPAARTPTGEIKNLQGTEQTPPTTEVTEKVEPKTEPEVKPKEGETLLTKKDDAKPTGAPEKYEEFKVPEGFKIDEAQATELGALFKELNLDQAQSQKLVDTYIAKQKEAIEAPYNAMKAQREEWQAKVKADPEIGSKLAEVKTTVSRALDSLGDPKLASEFREAMDFTGAGDHPAFIKAFYKLAQLVGEGKSVTGKGPSSFAQNNPSGRPKSAAAAMYPNLPE